jgi:molybdopterin-biosynthesis enzyme MoeA-like protein
VRVNESDIAEILNSLLREYPELILGSYPRINEKHYRVMLTLESRDSSYLERATDALIRNLPADSIHAME